MKQKVILAIVAFIILTNYNSTVKANWQGTGSETDPFLIWNKNDLEALADSVNNGYFWSRDKHFKLMNDITEPVRTVIGYFLGVFDGNNKKINLAINLSGSTNTPGSSGYGLFGIIGVEGVVRNVEVEGYINSNRTGRVFVGGISGINRGLIEYCINKCSISVVSYANGLYSAGGISGDCHGKIIFSVNFSNITSAHIAGGIVGGKTDVCVSDRTPTVLHCVNFGNISAPVSSGGILGHNSSAIILNCINLGIVSGVVEYVPNVAGQVGGIAGFIYGGSNISKIDNCINANFLKGAITIGGILGGTQSAQISNSINIGSIAAKHCNEKRGMVGSISGSGYNGYFENCFYDKQLNMFGGVGNYHWEGNQIVYGLGIDIPEQAEGLLTREMLGTQLRAILGDEHWIYRDGLYPMLKYFKDNKLCEVAISPVHFCIQGAYYENYNSIYNDFTMNIENGIKWTNFSNVVTISGEQGTVNRVGRDTLYAGKTDTFRLNAEKFVVMNARKTVPIKTIDTFLLTYYSNPEEAGIPRTQTKLINDALVTVMGTVVTECYRFVNWTDSATGQVLSLEAIYSFCSSDRNLTLIANFVRDTFNLVLRVNPEGAGTVSGSGRYVCGKDTLATIEAVATSNCYKFVNWTNANGSIVSTKIKDTIKITKDSILTANFIRDTFNLVLNVNPENAGAVSGSGRFACGKDSIAIIEAIANNNYMFQNWTDNNGNIISDKQKDTITITQNLTLTANFRYIGSIIYTIRASEHKLIDPRTRNYKIPIYIEASENVANATIEQLVIEIDRNVFYPQAVDNGTLSKDFIGDTIKMTFANVQVPELKANEEKLLLNIIGDAILGNKDSSDITLKALVFANCTPEFDFIDGYYTVDVCGEGGLRFWDYEPLLTVKNNPVSEMLEIECKTIENGDYSLEIVDMLGKSETVREFTVSANGKRIFDFEIPISNFSSGAYFIIMNTPSAKYSTKFVVQ